MSFEALPFDRRIAASIREAGFTRPTPIQEQAIPVVLEGRDVLGLAQTGTGKTAAFVLPILQRLTQGPRKKVRALIIAPTRELAEQIHQASTTLGKSTRVRSAAIYGGVGKHPQIAAVRSGAEIIVACPGRLLDHLDDGKIDLSSVEVLVLDEADRMCDMGFLPDIRRIIRRLPAQRQTLFFSATMPKDIRSLADSILKNPVTVQIGMTAPVETVSHTLYPVEASQKTELLFSMLKQTRTGRVLIFTRTKHRARSLALKLEKQKYRVAALQGNMTQTKRQSAINGFRNGKYDLLVATDIAARGIDVSEISHVINFDMPDTVDAYIHRIGRTGRANCSGEAFTFAMPADAPVIRGIEKVLGRRIDRRRLDEFDYCGFVPEAQLQQSSQNDISENSKSRRDRGRGKARPHRHKAYGSNSPNKQGATKNGEETRFAKPSRKRQRRRSGLSAPGGA